MNKRIKFISLLTIICLLFIVCIAVPISASFNQIRPELIENHYDGSVCSKCGKPLTGADGEQSEVAKAMGLTYCMECWLDALYGSNRSVALTKLALLGEDGKVLPSQLPSGIGAPTWGSIEGTLSDQTDLQSALNSKLSTITGTSLDNVFTQNGLLKRTGTGTYTIDSSTYLTGNQSISLSGDASGNGTTSISVTNSGLKGVSLPALSTGYLYYSGSAWAFQTPAGGGESENIVVKSGDTANSTTNLADATGLTFTADANSTYIVEVFLLWSSSATSVGLKVSATATNSPTVQAGQFITNNQNGTPDSSTWNANDVSVATSYSPFTTNNIGHVTAIIKTSGSSSVWTLRFAAETTGNITIRDGSTLRYRKVSP